MALNSSYHTIAEQVINFNNNVVDLLSKITTLISGNENTVTFDITNQSGISQQYVLPSFGYLKKEIDRLNNNLNSIYSINDAGALIQPSDGTKFRKIVTVDLNREPNDLNNLNLLTNFYTRKNWFFDGLLNPELSVEIDLSGQIENNVRKVLSRRYIPEFAKDAAGNFTPLGQSALNSFNTLFRNQNSFTLDEYLNWHENTPGLIEPLNPNYDEQMFDLEPNYLELDGYFSVVRIEEDTLNKKLFYHTNTLNYVKNTMVGSEMVPETKQLAINDEMIINTPISTTRYKIVEISTAQSNPRLRFERVEGVEPIPVGTNTLKIYSPVRYNKRVRISIGYNERNVLFVKSMNMDNYIMSKNWSKGLGFWTNDLREVDSSLSMEQYYTDKVYDYGLVLKDLVAKKTPNQLAGTPNTPTLITTNFKVVQINQHLTDTPDSVQLKSLNVQMKSLKSEVLQIEDAIRVKTREVKTADFSTESAKRQAVIEQQDLGKDRDSKSKLLTSVNSQILDIAKSPITKVEPKFRVRGFWDFPEAVITRGTMPQEIVQFRIQYRYLSKDGKEAPIEPFKITQATSTQTKTAAFANWIELKTDARKRVLDKATDKYYWEIQDITNADTPNINQIDIPIQANEKVEIRIASISEVGWPESPVESPFGETITIEFPDNLNNVVNENDFILKAADKEDLKVSINSELSAKGLDEHLDDQVTVNGVTYFHSTDKILSGFKDDNGLPMDLFAYLQKLENRVKALEERVNRVKGVLEVSIFRNTDQFILRNGSETNFNIELEDYLDPYTATNVATGRVYKNDIYVIKDFVMKIRNKSVDSPLSLLSNRDYNSSTNSDVYNSSAPQVFWVDQQNQLIVSNTSGSSKTQLDNQFIWSVNYDKVNQTSGSKSVVKLGQNIANNFTDLNVNSNSVTDILSSDSFNLGYGENEILGFVANNLSLFDSSKWIENSDPTAASLNKLLTTIHPQIQSLDQVQETNSDKLKTVNGGVDNEISVPLNIYFKMNSVDPTQTDSNYNYVDLNGNNVYVRHVKKLKFLLENEAENRPFIFTLQFSMNRAKTIIQRSVANTPTTRTQ
jgi:hypothetical protein